MDLPKQWYSIKETAVLLDCHYQTVWQMIRDRRIKTRRLTPRGNHRIPASEIQRLNVAIELSPAPPTTGITLRELART